MKKTLTGLFALFALATVHAQTPFENDIAANIPVNHAASPPGNNASPNGIGVKAVRHFYSTYGDNNNETWYAITNGYRAKFRQNGIAYMADYNKSGGWLRTIKTYAQDKLPQDIRQRVRQTYYDHRISLVQEINQYKQLIYLVSIEDDHSWMVLRLEGDDMEPIEKYTK